MGTGKKEYNPVQALELPAPDRFGLHCSVGSPGTRTEDHAGVPLPPLTLLQHPGGPEGGAQVTHGLTLAVSLHCFGCYTATSN